MSEAALKLLRSPAARDFVEEQGGVPSVIAAVSARHGAAAGAANVRGHVPSFDDDDEDEDDEDDDDDDDDELLARPAKRRRTRRRGAYNDDGDDDYEE